MCVCNPDHSPVGINRRDTAQLQPALLRLSAMTFQYYTANDVSDCSKPFAVRSCSVQAPHSLSAGLAVHAEKRATTERVTKSFSCTVRVMPAHHPAVTSQAIMRLRRGKISVALLLMVVCSPDDAPRPQKTKNRDAPDRQTQPPLPLSNPFGVCFSFYLTLTMLSI